MNLLTNTPKVILADISGVLVGGLSTDIYVSTGEYVDNVASPPTNYLHIIINSIQTTEQISLDGSPSFSFTDLEIANYEGLYDDWLFYVWSNRSIKLYIGEVGDVKANFTLVFDGLVADIGSKSRGTLNLKVRDKLQRLNTPLSETLLGGLSENSQALIPYIFGECFNVSPLLTDNLNSTYQVCGHKIEDIIESRVSGAPVSITKDLNNGKFNLTRRPNGDVTSSAQGWKETTYYNDIGNLIKIIVLNFGKPADMFQAGDIDDTNFNNYIASHTQAVGYYYNNKENIITIIQNLASSLETQVLCNRIGKLQLHQLSLSGTPSRTITVDDMVENSFSIIEKPEVKSTIMLHYCKNWTTQGNLQTGLANQSRSIMADTWRLVTSTDATVQSDYKQTTYPEPVDSYLVNKTEAQAEADRRRDLWKVQRMVYQFEGIPTTSDLTIGQLITLKHPRFGLSAGKTGLIIGVTINWRSLKTNIQVLV